MATQTIGKFATAPAVDSSVAVNTHDFKTDVADQGPLTLVANDSFKPESDTESNDIGDGIFRQHIEKHGKKVLVLWSKDEEARVVRKADFLFLPLFSVRGLVRTWSFPV